MTKTYYHIPPEEGWKEHSYYVVKISMYKNNPTHSAILYTGFLDLITGIPLGNSGIFSPLMKSELIPITHFEYIKAIRKIDMTVPKKCNKSQN